MARSERLWQQGTNVCKGISQMTFNDRLQLRLQHQSCDDLKRKGDWISLTMLCSRYEIILLRGLTSLSLFCSWCLSYTLTLPTCHPFTWFIDLALQARWECYGGRMKHLLRDMDMTVAKKEKLQLVIQFAGSGSLKAERVQFWLEGQQLKSPITPEESEQATLCQQPRLRGTWGNTSLTYNPTTYICQTVSAIRVLLSSSVTDCNYIFSLSLGILDKYLNLTVFCNIAIYSTVFN